ncbi:MAG: F0F1 ATP synthase subunit B' [Amaricoccus sp.]
MATDSAWIVIAQADSGHTEVAPADAAHATETTGEANMEHAESGMPQLDPAIFPNLIFWLILALFALFWVLSRMALPKIGTAIAERNDAIANDIEAAASLKRRAEEAEAAYNAALAQARDEAHKIAAEARAGIDKEIAALMAKADQEIGARTAESEQRIGEIRASAAESVGHVARDAAEALVAALLPDVADRAATDAAVANRLKG